MPTGVHHAVMLTRAGRAFILRAVHRLKHPRGACGPLRLSPLR